MTKISPDPLHAKDISSGHRRLPPPVINKIYEGDGCVTVIWKPFKTAAYYILEIDGRYIEREDPELFYHVEKGLENGKTYTLKIWAVDIYGKRGRVLSETFTPKGFGGFPNNIERQPKKRQDADKEARLPEKDISSGHRRLPKPYIFGIVTGKDYLRIIWQPVKNANYYRVELAGIETDRTHELKIWAVDADGKKGRCASTQFKHENLPSDVGLDFKINVAKDFVEVEISDPVKSKMAWFSRLLMPRSWRKKHDK